MANIAITSTKHSIVNPLLIILYLYQYGLLIPLLIQFDSQIPIAIFTLLLIVAYIITNGFPTNARVFLLICIPLLLILFKAAFTPVLIGEDNTIDILSNFSLIGISGILIGSISCDYKKILHYGTVIGWINFIILFSIPLQGTNDSINYMRFGYAMLPTFCFTLHSLIKKKDKIINAIIVLVSGIEIAIFGARGALLAICFFLLIAFFCFLNNRKYLLLRMVSLIGVGILYLFSDTIIYEISKFLSAKGYFSYSIIKILRIIEGTGDVESTSSGRFDIYRIALKNISENPIFGAPLNSALVDTGQLYYHNLLLEIAVSFGLIVFICFFLFIFNSIIEIMRSNNASLKWIYFILFILSFGRLMVSSVFWQRPEFWIFISFYVANRKHILKKHDTLTR